MTSSSQSPGSQIGFYQLDKVIGKGNFAIVRLANHTITDTKVSREGMGEGRGGACFEHAWVSRRGNRYVRVLYKCCGVLLVCVREETIFPCR